MEIEPLNKDDSARLLLSVLHLEDDATNRKIAQDIGQELDGLPLALSQMAGFMLQTSCPLDEFLQLYRARDNYIKLQSSSTAIDKMHYQLTLENVWDMSISRLDQSSKNILEVIALLDADGIPETLFKDTANIPDLAFMDSDYQ
jgi:hypothetical protein